MAPRRVLIAIDDSKQAQHTFDWYFKNFRQEGDHVLLVHCIEMPYIPGPAVRADVLQRLLDEAKEAAKDTDKKYIQQLKDRQAEGKFISEFGRPGHFICETATKEKASCIIIGTRGMGTIKRTLLGSVSDHVVHHAHCPVLICRQ